MDEVLKDAVVVRHCMGDLLKPIKEKNSHGLLSCVQGLGCEYRMRGIGNLDMRYREITGQDDTVLAKIIRDNLRTHSLDLPGTVYFDDNLDRLSAFYLDENYKRFYYVLLDDDDNVIGGIGLAEFEFFKDCAELQKLYLADDVKGSGIGYKLIELIENKAREYGYKRLYLETHTNLAAAVHIYEKCGFMVIEKPAGVVHATMNRFYIKDL